MNVAKDTDLNPPRSSSEIATGERGRNSLIQSEVFVGTVPQLGVKYRRAVSSGPSGFLSELHDWSLS